MNFHESKLIFFLIAGNSGTDVVAGVTPPFDIRDWCHAVGLFWAFPYSRHDRRIILEAATLLSDIQGCATRSVTSLVMIMATPLLDPGTQIVSTLFRRWITQYCTASMTINRTLDERQSR